MRHRAMLATPDMVLSSFMNHLAFGIDDRKGIKIPVRDDLRPARLTLKDEVGFVVPGQPPQPFRLLPWYIDKDLASSSHVRDIKDFIWEASQGALRERNQLHREVNGDHPHRCVDGVLNRLEIDTDVAPLTHCVDNGRDTHCV